jgi:hypothetical protein
MDMTSLTLFIRVANAKGGRAPAPTPSDFPCCKIPDYNPHMKKPVHDDLVAEFVKRLRSGGPLGEVFPQPVSECEFTETQKLAIQEAQNVRDKLHKKKSPQVTSPQTSSVPVALKPTPTPQPKAATPKPVAPKPVAAPPKVTQTKPPAPVPATKLQSLKKLEKMLYLQGGKCFFCGEILQPSEANIEHLYPLSKGGTRTEDNEVVCHKTLNETFGDMPLKDKFEFVLKHSGSFRCPKK